MKEKIVVIRDPKTFYFDFDWLKDVDENSKHEIEFNIKNNKSLAENKVKTRLKNCCPNISMKTIFINTENSKTNELHKCFLNFSQRLNLINLKT